MRADNLDNGGLGRSPWAIYAPLVGILLLGAVLRFYHLGEQPFWIDEGTAFKFAQETQSQIWSANSKIRMSPPLYVSLQHVWLIFGTSEAAFRSLSACFGVLTILLAYGLGRTVANHRVALFAAALLATSSFNIQYSQEARCYAALTAATTAALWATAYLLKYARYAVAPVLQQWATRPSGGAESDPHAKGSCPIGFAWLGYVLATTAALYLHSSAVLLPAAATIACVLAALRSPQVGLRFLLTWVGANVLVVILWSWWWPAVVAQSTERLGANFWVPEPTLALATELTLKAYGGPHLSGLRMYAAVLALALAAFGMAHLWRRGPQVLPATVAVVSIPFLTYLISLLRPVLILRVLLWPTVALYLCVALGLSAIRWRWLRLPFAAAVLLLSLRGAYSYHEYTPRKEPWDEVASFVAAREEPDDAVVLVPEDAVFAFDYYSPTGPGRARRLSPMIRKWHYNYLPHFYPEVATDIEDFETLHEHHNRVWGVIRGSHVLDEPEWNEVAALLEGQMVQTEYHKFRNLYVLRFEKATPRGSD
jgi:mannosyltransferase